MIGVTLLKKVVMPCMIRMTANGVIGFSGNIEPAAIRTRAGRANMRGVNQGEEEAVDKGYIRMKKICIYVCAV